MRFAVILAALAGGAGISSAASFLTVFTSVNGGAFVPGDRSVAAGDVVRTRYMCQTDNPAAVGLAGFSFYPLVNNWQTADDQLSPWTTPAGTQNTTLPGVNGPGVRDHDTGNGRLAPFAASSSTTVPTAMFGSDTLRIGGTGTAGRVAIGQYPVDLSTNSNGNFFSQANPVPVFQFTFTVGGGHALGTVMTIGADLDNQYARARWYDDLAGTTAIFDGVLAMNRGTLTIVPTPGGLSLLTACGILASRRRSRA